MPAYCRREPSTDREELDALLDDEPLLLAATAIYELCDRNRASDHMPAILKVAAVLREYTATLKSERT